MELKSETNDSKEAAEETESLEKREQEQSEIESTGQLELTKNEQRHKIHLVSVIGEIEGHELSSSNVKSTKYEHLLPELARLEDDREAEGLLLLINTMGGDVSAGLSLAEMVASLSIPTVSLVIGDCHSIGVPLALAARESFIVPTGTLIIHPVRMNGTVIGAPQTYDYFKIIQDRIAGFIEDHSRVSKEMVEEQMMKAGVLTKDLGTILVGEEAVKMGYIRQVGGIKEALFCLHRMIETEKNKKDTLRL